MTKKKKILLAAAVLVVLVLLVSLTGKDESLYAIPASETTIARERTYQAYLDSFGFADERALAESALDVFAFE